MTRLGVSRLALQADRRSRLRQLLQQLGDASGAAMSSSTPILRANRRCTGGLIRSAGTGNAATVQARYGAPSAGAGMNSSM